MIHLLVVEDDKNLRRLMTVVLKQHNYQVTSATCGDQALEILGHTHVDLLISDIMMPGLDGYGLLQAVRQMNSQLPILLVTAKEHIDDKKRGFLLGTDDYMVKPIDMDELILRIRALLRRSRVVQEHCLSFLDTQVNGDNLTLNHRGQDYLLPKKEFQLLFKLLSYPKKIFTRQQLMDEIWGMSTETDERTVDVHIRRLRNRVGHIQDFNIITVRGLGYKGEINHEKN